MKRMCLLGALLVVALSLSATAREPVALGLDHIPVAVRDLERATATFRALGFSLKPGREHGDGIRNAHVKFPNGAGLELLTVAAPAAQAVDDLSRHYLDLIRAGDGPAFMSLHARNTASLRTALGEAGYRFRAEGESTELERPDLSYLFVVRDNRAPTDRPEHFAHTNGATALSAVWIASENGESLARLLVDIGGRRQQRRVLAPGPSDATVVALDEGEVVILPRDHQVLPGRPVIGVSFRVTDVAGTRRVLDRASVKPWTDTSGAARVVVSPHDAHGLWIEFRAGRE